jgi:putative ABC transport system substrate-binding protein
VILFPLIALGACLGPFGLASPADSQETAAPRRIGVLLVISSPEGKDVQGLREGLRDAGYSEGRDVVIEWRSANGDYNRAPELATELVRRKVDVIVTESTPAAQAVKDATSTIPIVMAIISDPVASGLVPNLAHPGGNVTGLSMMMTEINAKRLQLLKEAIPPLTRVAVLWNPDAPWQSNAVEDLKALAPSLSIELSFVGARTSGELSAAFSAVSRAHAQALLVVGGSPFWNHRATLVKLASRTRVPVIYWAREFAEEGGLMSYGPSYGDLFRRSAGYVDKILKGAKPGDLPIEQPTQFELVVNLKTAKALGITIPESILLQAAEVIR